METALVKRNGKVLTLPSWWDAVIRHDLHGVGMQNKFCDPAGVAAAEP